MHTVAKDCDLPNNGDFYSLKIRARCFLVLIRKSPDAAAFFFSFDLWKWPYLTITSKFSIENLPPWGCKWFTELVLSPHVPAAQPETHRGGAAGPQDPAVQRICGSHRLSRLRSPGRQALGQVDACRQGKDSSGIAMTSLIYDCCSNINEVLSAKSQKKL